MLTPKLEELILCGKAFFKTAVVGGSKTTINIDNDRFIIITDITFLPYINTNVPPGGSNDANTQLSIYGERGFNHYFFANQRPAASIFFDGVSINSAYVSNPSTIQKIDCYLLHTTQVGFSFLTDSTVTPTSTATVAAFNNPAFEPPLDYGKDGMTGALNVDNDIQFFAALNNSVINRATGLGVGSAITQQVQLPANTVTKPIVNNNKFFPIANINYVEILGQPNNIGI